MSHSSTPVRTSINQDTMQESSADTNEGVHIRRIIRDVNLPKPSIALSWVERMQFSSFEFKPPYNRDQYFTLFNQFYRLVGRIPITYQDQDKDMDFNAIFVHRGDTLEETILIPVPATFFQEPFYPDEPPLQSALSTPSPAPVPPPPALLPPPQAHIFPPPPPLPPHIAAQLGIIPIPPRRTCWSQFKAMVIAQRMRIICYLMIIIIFTIFIIAIIR
jgi:hypothetical protein